MEEKIVQYRKYLEKYMNRAPNEVKILHVLHKLDSLPITLEHLQETGIGKAVNSYRKHGSSIGEKAKGLVGKWKRLVPVDGDETPAPSVKSETNGPSIKIETVSETKYTAAAQNESMRAPYMGKRGSSSESNDGYTPSYVGNEESHGNSYVPTPIVKQEKDDTGYTPTPIKQEKDTDGYDRRETCKSSFLDQLDPYSPTTKSSYEKSNHRDEYVPDMPIKLENGGSTEYVPTKIKQEKPNEYNPSSNYSIEATPRVKTEGNKSSSRNEKHKTNHSKDSSSSSRSSKHHSSSKHEKSHHSSRSHDSSKSDKSSSRSGKDKHDHKESRHKSEKSSSSKTSSSSSKRENYSTSSSKQRDDKEKSKSDSQKSHHSKNQSSSSKPKSLHDKNKKHERSSSKSNVHSKPSKSDKGSNNESFTTSENHTSGAFEPIISFDDLPFNEPSSSEKDVFPSTSAVEDYDLEEDVGVSMSDFELDECDTSKKKEKTAVKKEKQTEPEDENGGLSFEDFLNYDASTKVAKKGKSSKTSSSAKTSSKTSSKSGKHPSSSSSKDKPHKSSSSSSKSSSDKKSEKEKSLTHKSSSSHHKTSKSHKSSSSSSKQHKSSSGAHSAVSDKSGQLPSTSTGGDTMSGIKRKSAGALTIPPPPSKQLKLSHDDIFSTLPAISPDYKPLPRLPMPDKSPEPELQDMETTLSNLKQKSRTAVYSGRKQVFLTAVPSLYSACLRVLMDNIDNLDYVGGVPYDILKPVLDTCTPSQLYTIEDSNPQFIGESDELWQKHCQKDFRKYKPTEFESWRELYLRLHDEREARLSKITANISASMKAKAAPVKKTKLAYVDSSAKAPRDVRRRQQKFGTAGPMSKQDPLGQLSSHGGARPKVPLHRGPGPAPERMERARKPEVKPKAPMMAKTLKFMKSLNRR